jgi:general secretion pathway protein H
MRSRRRQRGFTLIEVIVALAIAVMLFSAAAISIGALTGVKARTAAGELGGVIRSLYDTAALSGKTCRLVFEMPSDRTDEGTTKYWAECASSNLTAGRNRDDELKEETQRRKREDRGAKKKSSSFQDAQDSEAERIESAAKYSEFTSSEIEPRELPGDVQVSVWTKHQRQAVSTGTAYLYFFPQGFTEKAHVYLKQAGNTWTLTVSPLTGKTEVVAEEVEVPRT